MLKRFFFNALSSFVGAWIALALFGFAVVLICIGIAARLGASDAPSGIKGNSILKLDLTGEIVETEEPRNINAGSLLQGEVERPMALNMIIKAISEAKVNKNIKVLYINCEGVSAAPATLNALLDAVLDFKKSGKKVYAYGDGLAQGDYFVASAADSLFLNPAGQLDLHGVGGTSLFLRGLFDKLGVKFTVCKVGTFKSAVEPYINTEMSGPARAQLDTLYGNMWSFIKETITQNRKLKKGAIDSLMNLGMVSLLPPEEVVKGKFVDRLVYKPEMQKILGRVSGQDPEKLRFVTVSEMLNGTPWGAAYGSKKQIAVLYATGEIAEGGRGGIDCNKLVPVITKLAEDDHVKGLVLRVNSPGGSVFGSDQIGNALNELKAKGKPFAVSMGDYAASGGYWISCEADRIFADPMTITGSIGIFGLFPNATGLLEKIGVNPQTVVTNPRSSFPSVLEPIDENKVADLQKYVERGYKQFTERVAKGRKMPLAKVLRIAEGRVWDGATAKKLGLVDQLGGLQDAVKWVSEKADLKDNYDVAVYPEFEPSFWDMIPLADMVGIGTALESYMKAHESEREIIEKGIEVISRKPVQARALEVKVRL